MPTSDRWLNYHQLIYFRVVARTGSLARASGELRLAVQTLSEHMLQLESALGETLFVRGSRGMTLTDTGRVVLVFAEEIHALGQEIFRTLEGGAGRAPGRLVVGVEDSLPKLLAWQVLAPAMKALGGGQLVCREASLEQLVEQLRAHVVDVVLAGADDLPTDAVGLRAERLRDAPLCWVADAAMAPSLRKGFPASLDGAPTLMPASGSALRRALDAWCAGVGVTPRVVAEFSDSALAKTACAEGVGVLAIPEMVLSQAAHRYGLERVGPCTGVSQTVYAIVGPRRIAHPGVSALVAPPG